MYICSICGNRFDLSQDNPDLLDRPAQTYYGHKKGSWTHSHDGYTKLADKEIQCLIRRSIITGKNYTHLASINPTIPLCPECIRHYWTKIKRNLQRAGIVAHWVIEINPENHALVHWHLTIVEGGANIKTALQRAMPVEVPCRIHLEPTGNQVQWVRYVVKGTGHHEKRLLFLPHLGLQKCGQIGKFWAPSKDDLWEQVKADNAEAHEGQTADTQRQAERAYELAYEPMNPSPQSKPKTLRRLNWIIGWFANKEAHQGNGTAVAFGR
jgi:hypothetical protein